MTSTDAVALVRRLHEHRMWASHNLLKAAEPLPVESLRRHFEIGQGSIWKSLTHLYGAEYVWLQALLGEQQAVVPGDAAGKIPGNQEGPGAIASLDELKTRWSALDARWRAYLDGLKAEHLDEPVLKVSNWGKLHATRLSDVLMHVCTHAQYTTAQVVNMLRHVGASPLPEVMLIALARRESPAL